MHGEVIEDLRRAVDKVVAELPTAGVRSECLVALRRELSRLEAATSAVTATFDAEEGWAADGAKGTVPWVATSCRAKKGRVRRELRLGRVAGKLPLAGAAWLAGELSAEHLEALAKVLRPATRETLQRDEALLVEQARKLSFDEFCAALCYWEHRADPEGCDRRARRSRDDRDVFLTKSFEGSWFGQMTLDPVAGEIVAGELERLETELYESDRAEAKQALGRDPDPRELPRTPRQRRADALLEMAVRSRSTPKNAQRPRPLFVVLVGYETLRGAVLESARGQPLVPGCIVPFLEEADVERAVFTPAGRVEVSERARLFTGATREAIILRDRRCTHPFCDERAERCQVDHVIPWTRGGPTTQANGRLACPFHNLQRAKGRDWTSPQRK